MPNKKSPRKRVRTERPIRCSAELEEAWNLLRGYFGKDADAQKFFVSGGWIPVGTEAIDHYAEPTGLSSEKGRINVNIGPKYWKTLHRIAAARDQHTSAPVGFTTTNALVRVGLQRFLFAERHRVNLEDRHIAATGFAALDVESNRQAMPAGGDGSTARRYAVLDTGAKLLKLTTSHERGVVAAALFPRDLPTGMTPTTFDKLRSFAERDFDGKFPADRDANPRPYHRATLAAHHVIVRSGANGKNLSGPELQDHCLKFVQRELTATPSKDPFAI